MAAVAQVTESVTIAQGAPAAVVSVGAQASVPAAAPLWHGYFTMDYWVAMFGMWGKIAFLGGVALVGAAVGYLIKRYSQILFTVIIGSVCVGALCEFLGLITVNWRALQQLCGSSFGQTFSSAALQLLYLVKKNALLYSAGLGGFIVGHMLGQGGDE